jgi:hypothetical protein
MIDKGNGPGDAARKVVERILLFIPMRCGLRRDKSLKWKELSIKPMKPSVNHYLNAMISCFTFEIVSRFVDL